MDCTSLQIFTYKTVQPSITELHEQPTSYIQFIIIDPFILQAFQFGEFISTDRSNKTVQSRIT